VRTPSSPLKAIPEYLLTISLNLTRCGIAGKTVIARLVYDNLPDYCCMMHILLRLGPLLMLLLATNHRLSVALLFAYCWLQYSLRFDYVC